MGMIKRFRTTAVIMVHALFPSRKKTHLTQCWLSASDCRSVIPHDIPYIMANPGCTVNGSGQLALFFPDCFSLAAPFLLMRLKRTGFSRCQAVIEFDGIILTAKR